MTDTSGSNSRYGAPRQKVAAFARYEGTSVWRKDRRRLREYNRFRDAQKRLRAHTETQVSKSLLPPT